MTALVLDAPDLVPAGATALQTSDYNSVDDRNHIRDKAYRLCKEYLKGRWETVPERNFHISMLSGGLTNKLYICRIPCDGSQENCPTTVVLRIHGLIIQDYAAQIQESVVFSILSERKIGPRLYAVFPGGRLEQYLECRTLCTSDLQDPYISRCIAKRTASYHMMIMPVNKQPTALLDKLQLYYDNLSNVHFDDDKKHSLLMQILRYDIGGEVEYIKQLLHDSGSPVVFCHNDLQEGNLLQSSEPGVKGNPIQLIDFEYSCYNYRGFDIGNHFCEWTFNYTHPTWPHFTYKPENYPTRKQQENFVEAYLKAVSKASVVSGEKWQIDFVIKDANRSALFSHIFWSLWSVMQAKISDIGFGYMEYALVRLKAYYELKNRIQ